MLGRVFFDLVSFGILYVALVFMIGMILAVLGTSNFQKPGPYKDMWDEEMAKPWREEMVPGEEWMYYGSIDQYVFEAIRVSLGDFDFDSVEYLES